MQQSRRGRDAGALRWRGLRASNTGTAGQDPAGAAPSGPWLCLEVTCQSGWVGISDWF